MKVFDTARENDTELTSLTHDFTLRKMKMKTDQSIKIQRTATMWRRPKNSRVITSRGYKTKLRSSLRANKRLREALG